MIGAPTPQIQAGFLTISLADDGSVIGLIDSRNGRNYIAPEKTAPLVSFVFDGKQVKPTAVTRTGENTYSFFNHDFNVGDIQVDVQATMKNGYTVLEVTNVSGTSSSRMEALLWGPLPTAITLGANAGTAAVGEAVGVVRTDTFAIGFKPLNDRTEGSWPTDYPQYGWQSDVEANPYGQNVDGAMGQWSVAAQTSWGSMLRAFTFDYTQQRLRINAGGYPVPVGPLDAGATVVGSKMALFGCAPELVTTILSFIAKSEGLPYPTQYGQWQKVAQASSQSTFVLNITSGYTPNAAEIAKSAGLNYIYALNTYRGPWQSTGHYQFNGDFGGNDERAAQLVSTAEGKGVHVGVHTMSDFISNNDAYINPPNAGLAIGGQAALAEPFPDTDLYLTDPWPVQKGLPTIPAGRYDSVLLVGNQYVGYLGKNVIVNNAGCKVTGVVRGLWNSPNSASQAGTPVKRVIPNGYDGALGGLAIINAIAQRFGTLRNSVGIRCHSFDGLESASDSGWGCYGIARLVNGTYAAWNGRDNYITECSRMTSNTWDTLTRASWGASQDSDGKKQLICNNAYYAANFLPGMLGWIDFRGLSPTMIQSWLSFGAGFNAGMGMMSLDTLSPSMLDQIKQWETARNLGAFTDAQKAAFRDPSTFWTLTYQQPGQWLLQQTDSKGNATGQAQTVYAPNPQLDAIDSTATVGQLFEAKVTANTLAVANFAISSGTLPPGLQLNGDTGGVVGTPTQGGMFVFDVTATDKDQTPIAKQRCLINVMISDKD